MTGRLDMALLSSEPKLIVELNEFPTRPQASSSEEEEVAADSIDNSERIDNGHDSAFMHLHIHARVVAQYSPVPFAHSLFAVIPRMEDPQLIARWRKETVCTNPDANHIASTKPAQTANLNPNRPVLAHN